MFGFPRRIPVVLITITARLFCSAAGVGALSAPPWCVLIMLCKTTHLNTMSLTTLGLWSTVLLVRAGSEADFPFQYPAV